MQVYDARRQEILDRLSGIPGRVGSIRLYLKNIEAVKRFSCATWTSRQHVIAAVSSGENTGFAECILSVNCPQASLEPWRTAVACLLGLDVGQAVLENRCHQGEWPEQLVEMMEMALVDLCGKLQGVPANHLLGLQDGKPVCGVHVILSDQMDEVAESTQWARQAGKAAYIKVKLFGDTRLDCDVIRTVRRYCPPEETFLIGDVNCGYRPDEGGSASLEWIARQLEQLREAGLDACEDPAFLEISEWVELQQRVAPLALIPDYPMRGSRNSIGRICRGMGGIYNIHPDSAGSIIDAVVLAGRIRELGADLMIGDDSLVGPSASIWQQLASGLDARWVEATEKRKESDFYYSCVNSLATDSRHNPISIQWKNGFGIDLDEARLARSADSAVEVKE